MSTVNYSNLRDASTKVRGHSMNENVTVYEVLGGSSNYIMGAFHNSVGSGGSSLGLAPRTLN